MKDKEMTHEEKIEILKQMSEYQQRHCDDIVNNPQFILGGNFRDMMPPRILESK